MKSSIETDENRKRETWEIAKPHRDLSHIQGWGADLDHANRPGYPMERMPARLNGVHWTEPEQQSTHMEIYHSTERPGITPVFGTSAPPKGCSGRLRSWAYKFSENDIRRWLMLMFADRVDTAEGIGEDLREGHVPNVFAEMGIKSELKYNRAGFVRKVAVGAAVTGVAYYLLSRRRER